MLGKVSTKSVTLSNSLQVDTELIFTQSGSDIVVRVRAYVWLMRKATLAVLPLAPANLVDNFQLGNRFNIGKQKYHFPNQDWFLQSAFPTPANTTLNLGWAFKAYSLCHHFQSAPGPASWLFSVRLIYIGFHLPEVRMNQCANKIWVNTFEYWFRQGLPEGFQIVIIEWSLYSCEFILQGNFVFIII